MSFTKLLAGTALAALLLAGPALAGPRLKGEALVEGDQIRLGDLIEGLDRGAEIPVFAAPAPGARGTIRAERVVAAAREMGIDDVEIGTLRSVIVVRTGRAISRAYMQDTIAKAVAEQGGKGEIEVVLDEQVRSRMLDSSKGGAIRVVNLLRDPRSGRFEARIAMAGSPDSDAWTITGSIAETREIAVLVNDVERGETVQSRDVALVRRPASQVGNDIAVTASDLVGMVSRRALRAGETVRTADLAKPILVEKNQLVTVTYSSGGLQLTMRGRVQQNGALGETVKIQNPQSKRMVEGTVTGQGQISITHFTPPTPPVADATTARRQ
ncbi:MAG: flagellar basal body P-ring formation chaperone FlgA [Proteobacteria bacterium]|nr:flagellar basal body P-ring formation chaperone FlgA [Pseudomonadota bacterium]